jgi:hypothetical protein
MKCQYCHNEFSNKQNLNCHQKKAKYCLQLQKKIPEEEHLCSCGKKFMSTTTLRRHEIKCGSKDLVIELTNKNKELEQTILLLSEKCSMLTSQVETYRTDFNKLSLTAVSHNFENEAAIEIDDTISESQFTINESDVVSEEQDTYQLASLEVGQGYTIEHREEDGYINVTNLCKAGRKQFKAWYRLDKTKAFLHVLSSAVLISTAELIKLGTGSKNVKDSTQGTWVHPQVAINISQWISPHFDVKVSGWVYEIMMTGKVNITATKTYKELQKENKDKEIKIQYLTKKYVKAQPRVQYKEENVVYILTTRRMKKDRVYILGKATNLTSRLSTYNKSDEHEVVFYASCGSEETMSLVESMAFQYLNQYREQANRERFILPEEKEITFFSNVIKKSVEFFKK